MTATREGTPERAASLGLNDCGDECRVDVDALGALGEGARVEARGHGKTLWQSIKRFLFFPPRLLSVSRFFSSFTARARLRACSRISRVALAQISFLRPVADDGGASRVISASRAVCQLRRSKSSRLRAAAFFGSVSRMRKTASSPS